MYMTPIAKLETVTNNQISPLPIFNQNILQSEANTVQLVRKTFRVNQDALASGTRTLYFVMKAPWAGTINSVTVKSQVGSVTYAVKIGATTVTGCSGSVTTTLTTANSTANKTFAAGAAITVDLSSPASLTNAQLEIDVTLTLPLV